MIPIFKNKKTLIFSIIATIIVFIILVAVERNLVNYTPTMKVVYCIKDIDRKAVLDKDSFIIKEVPITSVDLNTIRSLDEIKGKYAKENIYANEILKSKRIGTQEEVDKFILGPDEREISLTFDKVADTVGGSIRANDRVDIIFTSTTAVGATNNVLTETKFQNIRVLAALDSTGNANLKDTNITQTVILAVKTEEAHLIANLESKGKFKLVKCPSRDAKEYKNIIVIDGNIMQK